MIESYELSAMVETRAQVTGYHVGRSSFCRAAFVRENGGDRA